MKQVSLKSIPNIPGKHLSWSGVVSRCLLGNLPKSLLTSVPFFFFFLVKCNKNMSNVFNSFVS